MKVVIMMGEKPANVYAAKLQAGQVNAVVGTPLFDTQIDQLPPERDDTVYLVSAKTADALVGKRSDIYRLPLDASSNAPDKFGMDYLIKG